MKNDSTTDRHLQSFHHYHPRAPTLVHSFQSCGSYNTSRPSPHHLDVPPLYILVHRTYNRIDNVPSRRPRRRALFRTRSSHLPHHHPQLPEFGSKTASWCATTETHWRVQRRVRSFRVPLSLLQRLPHDSSVMYQKSFSASQFYRTEQDRYTAHNDS